MVLKPEEKKLPPWTPMKEAPDNATFDLGTSEQTTTMTEKKGKNTYSQGTILVIAVVVPVLVLCRRRCRCGKLSVLRFGVDKFTEETCSRRGGRFPLFGSYAY